MKILILSIVVGTVSFIFSSLGSYFGEKIKKDKKYDQLNQKIHDLDCKFESFLSCYFKNSAKNIISLKCIQEQNMDKFHE